MTTKKKKTAAEKHAAVLPLRLDSLRGGGGERVELLKKGKERLHRQMWEIRVEQEQRREQERFLG